MNPRSSHACAPLPALCCLAACLAVPTAAALAGDLVVAVTDSRGQPLADAVALLEPADGREAAAKPLPTVSVAQRQRQFVPRVTVVTVGTGVVFPNFDTVRHHVYSFSPTKAFELKLYAGVPNAPVVFDKPGVAVLGCNIHDQMAAWVVVASTPWYGLSGSDGQAALRNLPAGGYTLRVWHPGLQAGGAPWSAPLQLGAGDARQQVQLPVQAGS